MMNIRQNVRPLPVRQQDALVVLYGITEDWRTDHFPLLYRDAQADVRDPGLG